MKARKTTRSSRDGRAKQTEGNGPKSKPKTPRGKAGVARQPKRTTQQMKGSGKKRAK